MSLRASVFADFDQEMAATRKTLERIPEDKWTWKPHAKSFTMGGLASHIANMLGWMKPVTTALEFNLEPGTKEPEYDTLEELLAKFDANLAEARAALESASDEALQQVWTLKAGGQIFLSMPRVAVIRGMLVNHLIHHRAQLTVYFRMHDVPVPGLYGPSADES